MQTNPQYQNENFTTKEVNLNMNETNNELNNESEYTKIIE
jgi:hypothetical protein